MRDRPRGRGVKTRQLALNFYTRACSLYSLYRAAVWVSVSVCLCVCVRVCVCACVRVLLIEEGNRPHIFHGRQPCKEAASRYSLLLSSLHS